MNEHFRLGAILACALSAVGVTSAQQLAVPGHGDARADVILEASEPFEFNGLGEGLDLGPSSAVNVGSGDFTVHLRVLFRALTNEGGPCFSATGCDMSLVDKMASPTEVNSDGWRVLKQSDNRFWFCLGGGEATNGCDVGTPTTVISRTLAVPGVWHSVTAVKTDAAISIYVDGLLEGTTALGHFSNSDLARLRVGANDPEGALLNGRIDQLLLFKRALKAAQVRALHAASGKD